MIQRVFVCAEHPEYGGKGWKMKGNPWVEPFGGAIVPHDALEHFPGDKGSVEDELMALGASLFVRGEGEYYARKRNPLPVHNHIGSEFSLLYRAADEMNQTEIRDPGRFARHPDIADLVDKAIDIGRQELVYEYESQEYANMNFLDDIGAKRAAGWLHKGYRRALRRYGYNRQGWLTDVFIAVENKATKMLDGAEEGDAIRLAVNLKQCEFSLTELGYQDFY